MLDQSIWETSINLPPNLAVTGLLLANLMAFCIPFAFAIVSGLGLRALGSASFNTSLLTSSEVESGVFRNTIITNLANDNIYQSHFQ